MTIDGVKEAGSEMIATETVLLVDEVLAGCQLELDPTDDDDQVEVGREVHLEGETETKTETETDEGLLVRSFTTFILSNLTSRLQFQTDEIVEEKEVM